MKKVDFRGTPPALGKVLHDAVRSGKQVGAPVLNKVLKHLDPEKLSKRDIKQLRDAFDHGRLTPKARALAEKLLGHGQGLHKFRADEPVRPGTGPSVKPPVLKVKADEPIQPTPINPNILKVKADEPIQPTPINPNILKVKADEPIQPTPINPNILKVKADEPIQPTPINPNILKVKADQPL